MLVVTEMKIEGARVTREIGRIRATSGWHGAQGDCASHHDKALKALVDLAKEFEADAIIGIDFAQDDGNAVDLASVPVKRIAASGIAVKITRN